MEEHAGRNFSEQDQVKCKSCMNCKEEWTISLSFKIRQMFGLSSYTLSHLSQCIPTYTESPLSLKPDGSPSIWRP